MLELLDLRREFVNLFLEIVWRSGLGRGRPIMMDHDQGAEKEHDAQNALDHLLPSLTDLAIVSLARRGVGFGSCGIGDLGFGHEYRTSALGTPNQVFCVAFVGAYNPFKPEILEWLSSSVLGGCATVLKGMYGGYSVGRRERRGHPENTEFTGT